MDRYLYHTHTFSVTYQCEANAFQMKCCIKYGSESKTFLRRSKTLVINVSITHTTYRSDMCYTTARPDVEQYTVENESITTSGIQPKSICISVITTIVGCQRMRKTPCKNKHI